MIVNVANVQYRPPSNAEVMANAPLTVRLVHALGEGVNNYVARVGNHKVLEVFAPQGWQSYGSGQEVVICPFAGRYIPSTFARCTSTFGTRLADPFGSNNVEWRLYVSSKPYRGPQVFNAAYLPTGARNTAVNTCGGGYCLNMTQDLEIVRDSSGLAFFTLTAKRHAGGETPSAANIYTLDVWPEYI